MFAPEPTASQHSFMIFDLFLVHICMRTDILSLKKWWPSRSQQPKWVWTLFNWFPKEVWGIDGWHDVYVLSMRFFLCASFYAPTAYSGHDFSFLSFHTTQSFFFFVFFFSLSAYWTLHLVAFWAFSGWFQIFEACDIYPDYFPIVSDTSTCYLNDESICLYGIYFALCMLISYIFLYF